MKQVILITAILFMTLPLIARADGPVTKLTDEQIAETIAAIEAKPEIRALYSVYYRNHAKGDLTKKGSGCGGACTIAHDEKPVLKYSDCFQESGLGPAQNPHTEIFCNTTTLTKNIYVNGGSSINELTIQGVIALDVTDKSASFSLNSVGFSSDPND